MQISDSTKYLIIFDTLHKEYHWLQDIHQSDIHNQEYGEHFSKEYCLSQYNFNKIIANFTTEITKIYLIGDYIYSKHTDG